MDFDDYFSKRIRQASRESERIRREEDDREFQRELAREPVHVIYESRKEYEERMEREREKRRYNSRLGLIVAAVSIIILGIFYGAIELSNFFNNQQKGNPGPDTGNVEVPIYNGMLNCTMLDPNYTCFNAALANCTPAFMQWAGEPPRYFEIRENCILYVKESGTEPFYHTQVPEYAYLLCNYTKGITDFHQVFTPSNPNCSGGLWGWLDELNHLHVQYNRDTNGNMA